MDGITLPNLPRNFKRCRGLTISDKSCLFNGNSLYNAEGELMGTLNMSHSDSTNSNYVLFGLNHQMIRKREEKSSPYCPSCMKMDPVLKNMKRKKKRKLDFQPNSLKGWYELLSLQKEKKFDSLCILLDSCIKQRKILPNSGFYRLLEGIITPIEKTKSVIKNQCGLRYNAFVRSIFKAIYGVGNSKMFRILRGNGWVNGTFTGILPVPSDSTVNQWKSECKVPVGFTMESMNCVLEEFEEACVDDETILVGFSFDEMHIMEGLIVNRNSQEIVGFANYTSEHLGGDPIFHEPYSIPDSSAINPSDIIEGDTEDLPPIEVLSKRKKDHTGAPEPLSDNFYVEFMKNQQRQSSTAKSSNQICAFFMNLHNEKGRNRRKFIGYFPIKSKGHTANLNAYLLLQSFSCLASVINQYPRRKRVKLLSVVMDGDSSHRPLFKRGAIFGVGSTGYFIAPFLGHKTYYLQDSEHVDKRYRNSFYASRMENADKVLLLRQQPMFWDYLIRLYQDDNSIAKTCFLKAEDLELTARSKMKTTHATKVMSPPVVKLLRDSIGEKAESMATALENGRSFLTIMRSKRHLNQKKIEELQKLKDFFEEWKQENQTELRKSMGCSGRSKLPSGLFEDFFQTITAMISISNGRGTYGVKVSPISFSQNPVENYFSLIRSLGSGSNPTLQQTIGAITTLSHLSSVSPKRIKGSYLQDPSPHDCISPYYHRKRSISPHVTHKYLEEATFDENTLNSIKIPVERICKALTDKKELKMAEGSKVLVDMTYWLFRVCVKKNNYRPSLPQELNDCLFRFYPRFKEELQDSNEYSEQKFTEVRKFLSTVCLQEVFYNKGYFIQRGSKPLRIKVMEGGNKTLSPVDFDDFEPISFYREFHSKNSNQEPPQGDENFDTNLNVVNNGDNTEIQPTRFDMSQVTNYVPNGGVEPENRNYFLPISNTSRVWHFK